MVTRKLIVLPLLAFSLAQNGHTEVARGPYVGLGAGVNMLNTTQSGDIYSTNADLGGGARGPLTDYQNPIKKKSTGGTVVLFSGYQMPQGIHVLGVEGVLSYATNKGSTNFAFKEIKSTLKQTFSVGGNFLYGLQLKGFMPFVKIGAAFSRFSHLIVVDPSLGDFKSNKIFWKPGLVLGAGFKLGLTKDDKTSVRFDYEYRLFKGWQNSAASLTNEADNNTSTFTRKISKIRNNVFTISLQHMI